MLKTDLITGLVIEVPDVIIISEPEAEIPPTIEDVVSALTETLAEKGLVP